MITDSKKKLAVQLIWENLLVILGSTILALGTALFIVPFDLVTGGVSGIAIILENVLPFEISVQGYVTIVTWLLFFLGLLTLGKDFVVKTLISSIVYPAMLSCFMKLTDPQFMNGFWNLRLSEYGELSILLAAVFGGVLMGVGCAITFIGGGSTGGVDILGLLICKWFKRIKSSVVFFAIDAVIIVAGVFVIRNLVISLLGISSAFVYALVLEYVFVGNSKSFVAQIVSDKYLEITEEIIQKVDRTTTILDAVGGFSKEHKKVVVVSFSMRQYSEIISIIHRWDENAFVTINRVHEINGEGWSKEGINY